MPPRTPPELDCEHWRAAGRRLLARMVAELAYEELLASEPAGRTGSYRLVLAGGAEYTFRARRASFGAWHIDPSSLCRHAEGRNAPGDDPRRFILDARETLGLSGIVAAEVIRELTATQAADARLLASTIGAAELADLSHEELEGYQTGHPCMVLNKGRLGFSAEDIERYAPESRRTFRLSWIAVHRELATYQAVGATTQDWLLAGELDEPDRERFEGTLDRGGRRASDYLWLPVHPWHWDEVVAPMFASEIAAGQVVLLGEAPDRYLPLQSVRTLTNVNAPWRCNVKLPLLIRNTLVWRGLSTEETTAAPYLTAWLLGIRDRDPFLRDECRVIPLGEIASVSVRHPILNDLLEAPYRYRELLGAIWREPLQPRLEPGERARTMAALLLEDPAGRAFAAELVERSTLDARSWLRRLFAALLPPLLHYLYRYGAAFTPHGENVVIIYDDHDVPVRIAVKDFGADINLLPHQLPEYEDLPPAILGLLDRWGPEELCHSIQSAIFAGHFRFFTDVAERHLDVPEPEFWAMVRDEVLTYQRRFPQLAERFALFDLFAPQFGRVCLNREQLLGGALYDRADRDEHFDLIVGRVPNPLHR
jgi:siderophore synthetase component